MPAVDVESWAEGGSIVKESQVLTGRPSYINAILIQSRGEIQTLVRYRYDSLRTKANIYIECNNCASTTGPRPFVECVVLGGFFKGSCGNCKWRDHGAKCSKYNADSQQRTKVPAVEGASRIEELN